MTGPDPVEYGWWLASRGAGIVALLCITASVGVGLAMAGRVAPRRSRTMMAVHQWTALVGLVAIAVHGITLLGDKYLDPGWAGIAIPGVIEHEPLWTGAGIAGGWLAAILGLSYWVRNRIGAGLWRRLHRVTVLVYVTSVAHTLGSGTDAGQAWMQFLLVVTGAPIVFLFLMRVLPAAARPARSGPRRFRVAQITPESASVTSFSLEPVDGKPLSRFRPGQFLTVRAGTVLRSYSLSAGHDPARYRISVKREPGGAGSGHLHTAVDVGDVLEATGPAGTFVLDESSSRPVVLLSAGVGATPVLAILHRLAETRSPRPVWWIHGARSDREHPFREEVRGLVERLPDAHLHVRYSSTDGRWTPADLLALGIPADAEWYLCGPGPFLDSLLDGLTQEAVPRERIAFERFAAAAPKPKAPAVAFSRSGVSTTWDPQFTTLLDLAEAHSVPAASGCRVGACHGCRTEVLEGTVRHDPEPLQAPPAGSALLCCAKPEGDVVLDV